MNEFIVEISQSRGDFSYDKSIPVYLEENLNETVGACNIIRQKGKLLGVIHTSVTIKDDMYFLYRAGEENGILKLTGIQIMAKAQEEMAKTIAQCMV